MPNIPWTAREAVTDGCSGRIPFTGSIRRCWLSCLIFSDGMGRHAARRCRAIGDAWWVGMCEACGVLKKGLLGHLRSERRLRRSQHSHIFRDERGQIADAISIRERPAEIRDRAIPGHWECDL